MSSAFLTRLSPFLRSLLSGSPAQRAPSTAIAPNSYHPDPDYKPALEDIPRYPPFDRGLPFLTVDQMLDTQRNYVDRVHDTGLPYADQAVRNLAAYVQLLPATSNDFFCGAGGLFRLCMLTGFHSFVAAQGNIFTAHDPAEKRRELEAKWQLAAFLAGLCCDLSRAIVTSVVTNDHGEQWLPFEPITTWLSRTNAHRYFLRPPQSPALANHDTAHLSGVIVNSIIPPEALQHITTDDRNILMSMLSTITRITDTYNSGQFPKTVRHIRSQVIERDKETNPLTFGKPLVGVHLEPYLVNGMRQLVRDGSWKINQKLARVHVAPDGAFIFWATGVAEIVAFLRAEGTSGVPSDPRTLGELLMRERIFEANPDGGGLWHYVRTPHSASCYEVVKLSNPSIILDDETLATITMYPAPISVSPAEARAAQPADPSRAPSSESPGANGTQLVVQPSDDGDEEARPAEPAGGNGKRDYRRALEFTAPRSGPGAPPPGGGAPPARPSSDKQQQGQPGGKKVRPKAEPPKGKELGPGIRANGDGTFTVNVDFDPRAQGGTRPPRSAPRAPTHQATPPRPVPSSESASPASPPAPPADPIARLKRRASLMGDMQRLLKEYSGGASPMTWCEHGLAIPLSLMTKVTAHVPLINALAEAGAIYIKPGENSKWIDVDTGDGDARCVCLLPHAAREFGFEPHEDDDLEAPLDDSDVPAAD